MPKVIGRRLANIEQHQVVMEQAGMELGQSQYSCHLGELVP